MTRLQHLLRAVSFVRDNAVNGTGYRPYSNLTSGGIMNSLTGQGGAGDKAEGGVFLPTRIVTRQELETVYVQSWPARKFIDIPIDDMFVRWRVFTGEDEAARKKMEDAEKLYMVRERLSAAMKAARLYGTGMLIMMTGESDMLGPLNVERLREHDLLNLLPVDRFDVTVNNRIQDPFDPLYGSPEIYRIFLRRGGHFNVHCSRVLRFDGMKSLSAVGWTQYDQDWGVSELIPVVQAIMQDAGFAGSVTHLGHEASIPVIKLTGYKEALTPGHEQDEISPEDFGARMNQLKSVFRTLFLDSADSFERVGVSFAGMSDLMDRFARRLAAAADIPATRFWGQAPVGLNATGDSDMKNYAIHVKAMQEKMLPGPLKTLDMVLARTSGLKEPPTFDFHSLMDISEDEQAKTFKTITESIVATYSGGLIDEDEAREVLRELDMFGDLKQDFTPPPRWDNPTGDPDADPDNDPNAAPPKK